MRPVGPEIVQPIPTAVDPIEDPAVDSTPVQPPPDARPQVDPADLSAPADTDADAAAAAEKAEQEKLTKLALKVPAAENVEAAIAHYNDRRFIQAAEGFERAIHQGGRNWLPVMMLGLCKVKLEKWEEGRALLDEALRGGGRHAPIELRADAAFGLAMSAEALKMRQEAFNRLRQCFKLTGEVDRRLMQLRKESRFKQLRADPEYQKFLTWVDNLGSKRRR
jgi:tetratricopeptide (TPR) repeat protein